jgi:hypothetical protein
MVGGPLKRSQVMTTTDEPGHRPVIEVLYVQDCPHYPATLALVERVRAELGIDTEPATEYTVACRLYRLEHRFAGHPEERWVREALLEAAGRS